MSSQQIINIEIDPMVNEFMHCKNLVKCNNSRCVEKFIRQGVKYVIEFPDTKEILNAVCYFKALNAADMKIVSSMKDGVQHSDFDEYCISYNYESYDAMYHTSFSYKEKCNIYVSINDVFR
jgi:hypothetical protein